MRKRKNWFSAMKSCCIPPTKKKLKNVSDNRGGEKEKKALGRRLTQRKSNSFIPLFREPSSIEKIFSEFEKESGNIEFRPPIISEESRVPPPITSPIVTSPRASSHEIESPKGASPPTNILCKPEEIIHRPEPTPIHRPEPTPIHRLEPTPIHRPEPTPIHRPEPTPIHRPELTPINYQASATKIQAMYRGHMARRGFRALKGLVRLQGVVSGQNVKRQTVNAMKQMQRLVRVQAQIQSWRRIQIMQNQSQNQDQSRLSHTLSEAGNYKNWDDSFITKKERDARMQRKMEAIINKERAMSYAYSKESWKDPPKSAQETPNNPGSAGDLRWCNWLERQLPLQTPKNFLLQSPCQPSFSPRKSEASTPKSLKSTATKPEQTPALLRSSPAKSFSNLSRFSRQRPQDSQSLFDTYSKDGDSLVSCPQFSGPRYMAPTISFKAKEKAIIYPRDRFFGTPRSESNRRLSYPLTPVSRFAKADENQSVRSAENSSVASPVSLPARVDRRPFSRFV